MKIMRRLRATITADDIIFGSAMAVVSLSLGYLYWQMFVRF